MIGVIAEHIKTHRHQLGKHALFVGSAVKIPPDDVQIDEAIRQVAVEWAAERVADLEGEERVTRALELMADGVPDGAERCRLVRDKFGPEARPGEGHVRLARLIKDGYYSTLFVAEPDDMLERALQAQHMEPDKDYHRLVAGLDESNDIKVALAESSRVAIVKCGGDLEQRFLPLSPTEMEGIAGELGLIIAESFKLFSVFVGMTARDDPFLAHVPREGARVFWINQMIPMGDSDLYDELRIESPASAEYHKYQPEVMGLLEQRNSARHLLCREPGSFNEFFAKLHGRLVRRKGRRRGGRRDLTVLRGGPYRFLGHFDVEDVDFYFGREDDVEGIMSRVREHPITVVFGTPAIGKTSLLRAGIMARLQQESEDADKEETWPWLVAYTRLGGDPVASIRRSLAAALVAAGHDPGQADEEAPLHAIVTAAAEVTGRHVVVLLDQFAEYSVKLGEPVKERFRNAVSECLRECGDSFRLLIAIREDFVGELFELQSEFPQIMHNMHRLRKLTREQAEDAVLKPAQNFDLQVERALLHRIVDDLYREGVAPIELQIVMHSLYEELSPGGRVISQRIYDRLGGAVEILDKYLERALDQLPASERKTASEVLTFVAAGSELKAAHTLDRIADEIADERETTERVLAHLVDTGLLRSVGKGRQREYELMHEVLADKVESDLAGEHAMPRNLNDLLARAMNNSKQFDLLIEGDALRLLGKARDELALGNEELQLIIRSALTAEVDVDEWFEAIGDLGDHAGEFIASLMRDEAPQVRQHTYERLTDHLEARLIRHLVHGLDDEIPEVRALAGTYLAQLERHLLAMLQNRDERVRALAARALGHVGVRKAVRPLTEAFVDSAPALRDELTSALLEIDDARAPEMLLRAVSAGPEESWSAAHALGRLSVGESDLQTLQKAATSRPRATLLYALGVALMHRRNLPEASEALEKARESVQEGLGLEAIREAQASLQEQRARALAGEEAWLVFGRVPAHGAATPQEVSPPLEQAWEFETGDHVVASPVVRDNTVYVGSRDKRFYAIDTGKGTARWTFNAPDRIEGAAALTDRLVCFATLDGCIIALHAASGEEAWRQSLGAAIRSGCAVDGDALYLGARDGELARLDATSGEIIWGRRAPGEISSTAATADGLVIVGCWDGHVLAYDADTGNDAWDFKTQDAVSSSPAISDGVVYCGSDDHGLYALDLHSGAEVWRADLGGHVRSSPALSGDTVVVGSIDGNCYAVSRRDGAVLWTRETEEEIMSSPAISGGYVYIGSKDGALYALSLETGEVVWRQKAAFGVYSSPAVAEETVFVGFAYYNLAAFRPTARTGKVK